MSKSTPGPWTACNGGTCPCLFIGASDHPIAKVLSGKWGDDYPAIRLVGTSSLDQKAEAYMDQIAYGDIPKAEAEANARLIAAAPELLKTLKYAIRLYGASSMSNPDLEPLRAAIAKAEAKS